MRLQEIITGHRTVRIPSCAQHEGFHAKIVTLSWRCLYCDGPRGEPYDGISYDGSRRLAVHRWENPCGHIETYAAVRRALEDEEQDVQWCETCGAQLALYSDGAGAAAWLCPACDHEYARELVRIDP